MDLAISSQTYGGACVIAVVIAAVLFRSQPPRVTARFRPLPDEAAQEFYLAAVEAEVESRKSAAGRFQGSVWSQDDEVHNREARFLGTYGRTHRLSTASLVDALDRGMHEHWPTPGVAPPDQKVRPCRPRLTY